MQGLDSTRNSITKNDAVKVVDGENKGKKGTIIHIYKNIVFLYNPEQATNNGIFVEKTRNLTILGAELLKGNNEVNKERRNRPKAGNSRYDELYRKLVRITAGQYKGYQGIVVDMDKNSAKVELSSKAKIINIQRKDIEDASKKVSLRDNQAPISDAGSKTPAYLPQSPQWMPSTPAPQSPGHNDCKSFYSNVS